jgi:hypothetical protein
MANKRKYKSFNEFYPHYLEEHKKTGTRVMHFIGTSLFFGMLVLAYAYQNPWLILLGITLAYLNAWIGHFFIEKNKPATFQYPLWSLIGDFKLYFSILLCQEELVGE